LFFTQIWVSFEAEEKILPEIYLLPLLNVAMLLPQPSLPSVIAGIRYLFHLLSNRFLLQAGGRESWGRRFSRLSAPACLRKAGSGLSGIACKKQSAGALLSGIISVSSGTSRERLLSIGEISM
jgi:hypothetical protein